MPEDLLCDSMTTLLLNTISPSAFNALGASDQPISGNGLQDGDEQSGEEDDWGHGMDGSGIRVEELSQTARQVSRQVHIYSMNSARCHARCTCMATATYSLNTPVRVYQCAHWYCQDFADSYILPLLTLVLGPAVGQSAAGFPVSDAFTQP